MSAFVTITGNLTRDPEMTTIGSQQACRFSVGVRTRTKNKEDGGYKSNFYECTFFGKQAEYFFARAQKGTAVTVFGDLTVDAYLSNGEPRPGIRLTVTAAECQAKMKDPSTTHSSAATSVDNEITF